MPKFKENTSSAMKRSGFKMKGYHYAGTSPVQRGKTSWRDKAKAAWTTFKTHLDPDEKLGEMGMTYALEKRKLREGK